VKINGKVIDGPKEKVVVIPRDGTDIVFKAKAVLDYSDYEKICPMPTPPEVIKPGGEKSLDVEDADYIKALDKWARNKSRWMILKSLSASPGLEWETVDMSKPDTWENYHTELQSAFSSGEIARILGIVTEACGLNQDKIDEATKRFLAGQGAVLDAENSQDSEQSTTQSGEHVKG